ncbi:transglutaminase family protein [Maribacter sp. SA7]|uniref:transglutaminase-like domain-containing protein n=1 Tax=Maribacter zhoushanensis TaxID=3030012 RepID=UPI0023EC5443|nr:transglutaminase family protein [Maribacter zhoushanensis]MDF4204067.1 transglutaminase family protein [Maribacter zhoushanensis]
MPREFEITYNAKNIYDDWVYDAHWQFLIIPVENENQHEVEIEFSNSLFANTEYSINGYGFKTLRVHPKKKFKEITFEAKFKFSKEEVDPYNFKINPDISLAYNELHNSDFKIIHERFLKSTPFTSLENKQEELFKFDNSISIFDNLEALNLFIFKYIKFTAGVTEVGTPLKQIIAKKKGVCQDFTHLFCALARNNGVPTRYVSGYLDQDSGYVGDSQMHAWAEAYIPEIGWKGFDPTNNILANTNHIKVCYGKDYNDCAPLKGIIHSQGRNKTIHTVTVESQQ